MDDKEIASATNIKKIMEQNNYINMILKTLEDQLNKVEEVIQYQKHIKTTFIYFLRNMLISFYLCLGDQHIPKKNMISFYLSHLSYQRNFKKTLYLTKI